MKRKSGSVTPHVNTLFVVLCLAFTSLNSYGQTVESQIQQTTEIINGLGELFAPTPAQLQRREAAEKAAQTNANLSAERRVNAENAFQRDYLNTYLSVANEGNEECRMYLMMVAVYEFNWCSCDLSSKLPNRNNWLKEAIKNNNLDAINLVGSMALNENRAWNLSLTVSEGLRILENAASDDSHLRKSFLGISFNEISPELRKEKKLGDKKGIYVSHVMPNSSANEAGLQEGDVILLVENTSTITNEEFVSQIALYQPGEAVRLTYLRGGKELFTTAVLKSRPIDQRKVDIMVNLADYYNKKASIRGGNNPAKAFYWYTKAAENGSPNAMNALGNIYLNGKTVNNMYVVIYFTPKRDSKLALDWFLRSIADPYYQTTSFQKRSKTGSCFTYGSYDSLIKMYERGIGCPRSKEKADELTRVRDELVLQEKLSK